MPDIFSRGAHPHAAVLLTAAVGIVSLITGITYIGAPVVLTPLDQYVPASVRGTVGFTGTLTGFLLLLCAFGLRWGYRVAWRVTLMLLPATAMQALLQSSPLSLPLLLLSIAAMPTVYRFRASFQRATTLDESQIAAAIALAGVLVYGTVGTFALRGQFRGIDGPLDALYYTIVTATTVGYGDTVPVTPGARLFSLSIIVLGVVTFILAAGVLLAPLLESRFKAALGMTTTSELEQLNDHVLVLGYGNLTESILTELDGETDVIVLTDQQPAITSLTERGIHVIRTDPRAAGSLERAQIDRARSVIAATDSDGDDALAILTVKRTHPDAFVVAGASDHANMQSLRDAGADAVISPAVLGSQLLAQSALQRQKSIDVDVGE